MKLLEKKAYDLGVVKALLHLGVIKVAAEVPSEKAEGKETRLKKNHEPHSFYSVKRNFERAGPQKKEVGTHVDLSKKECT